MPGASWGRAMESRVARVTLGIGGRADALGRVGAKQSTSKAGSKGPLFKKLNSSELRAGLEQRAAGIPVLCCVGLVVALS